MNKTLALLLFLGLGISKVVSQETENQLTSKTFQCTSISYVEKEQIYTIPQSQQPSILLRPKESELQVRIHEKFSGRVGRIYDKRIGYHSTIQMECIRTEEGKLLPVSFSTEGMAGKMIENTPVIVIWDESITYYCSTSMEDYINILNEIKAYAKENKFKMQYVETVPKAEDDQPE